MFCPYCTYPLNETSDNCPQCHFTIHGGDALFGTPPDLALGINDHVKALNSEDTRTIMAQFHRLANKYPQIRFAVVTMQLAPETSLPTLATWLFNRAGLFRSQERGGKNYGILIAVATSDKRASIQIGYGLEPFIGYRHLQSILESTRGDFEAAKFGRGIQAMIAKTEHVLDEVHGRIEKTYGIDLNALKPTEAFNIGLIVPTEQEKFAFYEWQVDPY